MPPAETRETIALAPFVAHPALFGTGVVLALSTRLRGQWPALHPAERIRLIDVDQRVGEGALSWGGSGRREGRRGTGAGVGKEKWGSQMEEDAMGVLKGSLVAGAVSLYMHV